MNDEFPIFIFATGLRCGSTLLQRFLNSNPSIWIWGESSGAINLIYDSFRRFDSKITKGYMTNLEDTVFKFGPNSGIANVNPPEEVLLESYRVFFRNYYRDSLSYFKPITRKIWGFKEVRCDFSFSEFMNKLFPGCKILFLTRDPVDVYLSFKTASKLWGGMKISNHYDEIRIWTKVAKTLVDNWKSVKESSNILFLKYEELRTNESIRKISELLQVGFSSFDKISVFNKVISGSGDNQFFEFKRAIDKKCYLEDLDEYDKGFFRSSDLMLDLSDFLGYETRKKLEL